MWKDIIILVIVLYIVSRIVRFVMPIFRVTTVANDHIRRMQEQMKEMNNHMDQQRPTQNKNVEKEGDYIDYEEIK